jgi:ABC-2 type transport system ATP-binding protein
MTEPMIQVDNLVFEYPGKRVIHGVSFKIEKGTVTALVGPNGAGKTTIMRCIAALLTPFSGSVAVQGLNTQEKPRECHRLIGYLPDFFGLYDDLSVAKVLTFMARINGVARRKVKSAVEETLENLDLTEYANSLAGTLSRGLRQRLAIGHAIVHSPPVLLLDEPASGLDPEARHSLSRLILRLRDSGSTIMVSSHILAELADYSTAMLAVSEGRLLAHDHLEEKKLQTSKVLRVNLARPHPDFERILSDSALVSEPSARDLAAEFVFQGNVDEQHQLLKQLLDAGLEVKDFYEEEKSLQDIYLEQVKRADLEEE